LYSVTDVVAVERSLRSKSGVVMSSIHRVTCAAVVTSCASTRKWIHRPVGVGSPRGNVPPGEPTVSTTSPEESNASPAP